MSELIAQLPSSHLAIIPEWAYTSAAVDTSSSPLAGDTRTEIDDAENSAETGVGNGIAWEHSKKNGAKILDGKVAQRRLAEARPNLNLAVMAGLDGRNLSFWVRGWSLVQQLGACSARPQTTFWRWTESDLSLQTLAS